MIKKFLFLFLLLFHSIAFSENLPSYCRDYYNQFSQKQLEIIEHSFNYGKKNDLGYTMAAIAIQESIAGRVRVNVNDPSGGVHHIIVYKVVRALGKPVNSFTVNQTLQRLINDVDLSARFALKELLYWRTVYSGDWRKMVASYNAGWKHENGKQYAEKVSVIVNKLMNCSEKFFNQ